jgi:hypothetical protein
MFYYFYFETFLIKIKISSCQIITKLKIIMYTQSYTVSYYTYYINRSFVNIRVIFLFAIVFGCEIPCCNSPEVVVSV